MNYFIATVLTISILLEIVQAAKRASRTNEISSSHFTSKIDMLEEYCNMKSQSLMHFAESTALMISISLCILGPILFDGPKLAIAFLLSYACIVCSVKGISAFYINLKAEKIKRDFYPPRSLD